MVIILNDDNSIKTLSKVFVIVFIIIFSIVLIYLVKYIFSVDSQNVNMPTTTTKRIDKSYIALSNADKLDYNAKLADQTFLIPLNNAIAGDINYQKINLLQSEKSHFIYLYTKIKLNKVTDKITLDLLNTYSEKIFNSKISADNIKEYLVNDEYVYNVNYANPNYCLKATHLKKTNTKLSLKVDLISFSSEICNTSYLDYDDKNVSAKAELTVTKDNNENYYIDSFMITD